MLVHLCIHILCTYAIILCKMLSGDNTMLHSRKLVYIHTGTLIACVVDLFMYVYIGTVNVVDFWL